MSQILGEMINILNNLFISDNHSLPVLKSLKTDFIQRLNSLEKNHRDFRNILINPVLSKKNPFLHDICSKSFELIVSKKDSDGDDLINKKVDLFQEIFNSLIEKMKTYGIKSSEIKNKGGVNTNDYIDSYVENIARTQDFDEDDDIMIDIMEKMLYFQAAIGDLDKSTKSRKASTSKERKKSPDNPEMEKLKQRIKDLLKENGNLRSKEERMKLEISDLLKKKEELKRHIGYQDHLIETHWESHNELTDLLSKSKKKIKTLEITLEIFNENKAGVIKGRDTKINRLARENRELQTQLKKANTNIKQLEKREKECKQKIEEAAKEKARMVKLIESKEKVEKNILSYTNNLQKAYDSMAEKIVKESEAFEVSTKKLENMERKKKEMAKSKLPGETIEARFKRLKEDSEIPMISSSIVKMKKSSARKSSASKSILSYGDFLERFKTHRKRLKALSVEGKKFRIVNIEDLKDISLKPKVFTGTRKRRPSIINNATELMALRRSRAKEKAKSKTKSKTKSKSKTRRVSSGSNYQKKSGSPSKSKTNITRKNKSI